MRPNRLEQIKQKQLEEGRKNGIDNYRDMVGDPKHSTPIRLDNVKTPTSSDSSNLSGIGQALFEQLKAAMETDVQRLKTVHKMEEKVELKRELLPNYLPFVLDYINHGHDYPNSVAVRVMIWLFDVGDIENALNVGLYLVRTGNQYMPSNFERGDLQTFICDAVYDWANVQLKAEHTASPYLEQLTSVMLESDWSLAPMVKSKVITMLAKHEFTKEHYSEVVKLCELAEAANPEGHGTKTLKGKAQKELDKAKTE